MESVTQMPKTPTSTGVMSWMNTTGDSKIHWDARSEVEVAAAQANYAVLRAAGYRAFALNTDGTQGEQLDDFDALAKRIVMVPPLAGG